MLTQACTYLDVHTLTPLPKVTSPLPVLSNSWKATMNKASGAHRTDSNATNSWKDINLQHKTNTKRKVSSLWEIEAHTNMHQGKKESVTVKKYNSHLKHLQTAFPFTHGGLKLRAESERPNRVEDMVTQMHPNSKRK